MDTSLRRIRENFIKNVDCEVNIEGQVHFQLMEITFFVQEVT